MTGWPAHGSELRPWRQARRAGSKADRVLTEVTVAVPPRIARRSMSLAADRIAAMEVALAEVVALDRAFGDQLTALGTLLLRTESVASSKIEFVEAGVDDYARALHGIRANGSATSMVSATVALAALLRDTEAEGRIDAAALLRAHAALMADDQSESEYRGKWRDVQNWIGGSDYSPLRALYVPPPPEAVADSMRDLLHFANRDDLPALAQAAVAHAQFESVHPFTDGNGRIGRALINAILRRRRVTTRVVVPIASALVVRRDRYFRVLGSYRDGDLGPLIDSIVEATRIAAAESQVTGQRLADLPEEWADAVGRIRAGSAVAKLIKLLPDRPVLSADDACREVDAPTSSVYAAIERLHEAGVLRPLTDRKRNRVWGASAVLAELDDLAGRIAEAVR